MKINRMMILNRSKNEQVIIKIIKIIKKKNLMMMKRRMILMKKKTKVGISLGKMIDHMEYQDFGSKICIKGLTLIIY